MIETLAALALGPLDRARGHTWPIKGASMIAKIAYGYAMALAFGHYAGGTAALITAGMVIGCSFGFGNPLGSAILGIEMDRFKLEKWQTFELVKTDPWWALAYRGIIWGASIPLLWMALLLLAIVAGIIMAAFGADNPSAMFDYVRGTMSDWRVLWLIPAYSVAMPAAVELALMIGKQGDEAWAASEFLRGGIVGVIVLLVTI